MIEGGFRVFEVSYVWEVGDELDECVSNNDVVEIMNILNVMYF